GAPLAFGTATTLTFTNGLSSAGGSMRLYKAQSATITASQGALTTTGGDRLAVTVSPASPSGAASAISASPSSRIADGSAASTLTVQTKDAFGNGLTSGGASVVLSSDRGTHSSVSDNADGTYSASLTSTSAGLAHVTGTVNGAAIGPPATVTFLPDSVSAGHTTVAASSGSASTDTGSTVTVTVTAKDANDNTIPNAHVTLD